MKPLKGYLIERKDGSLLVGASRAPDRANNDDGYNGPHADVYVDRDWLFIITDSHEGTVMLNVEALSHLRRALAMIAKQLRVKQGVKPS